MFNKVFFLLLFLVSINAMLIISRGENCKRHFPINKISTKILFLNHLMRQNHSNLNSSA